MSAPCNNDRHFIIQLMRNIQYVDTIKIIKYLKVLQHLMFIGPCVILIVE